MFLLKDLPTLPSLEFSRSSYLALNKDWVINDFDNLEELVFGAGSFCDIPSLTICNLPKLQRIKVCSSSSTFFNTKTVTIESKPQTKNDNQDLPKLLSIITEERSFYNATNATFSSIITLF